MSPTNVFSVVKEAGGNFLKDQALVFAASLAFYTALSLAPLLVVLIGIMGLLGPDAQQNLVEQIRSTVGPQAAEGINMILANMERNPGAGRLSTIFGSAMLLIAATGLFIQLQTALNRIWDVKVKPGQAIWGWFRKRLMSLGMVLGIVLIAFVSLFISAGIEIAFGGTIGGRLWQGLNLTISLLIFILLFAMIYRYLPDVNITWHDVLVGAVLTSILFVAGKWAISLYLGYSSVGSAYGAAGSLVVLLLWVYYAALILFFGAELTQVYARRYGTQIMPDRHAQRTQQAIGG